jgi:pimeloyl-ACP methyl ester carboxylesterase
LLTDLANSLSPTRTIISVDVAGNGDSDPLPERDSDLAAYAADVLATMDACGIDEFDMYGESAGAVLALAIAQRCGKRAGKLILDRPEIGSAEELEGLLSDIAPPIEARWDGTHFLTAWHMLRDAALFWPWYRRTAGAVRDIEPEIEPVALQARLLAWLKGRLDYGDFVRAALGTNIKALTDCIENPCIVYGQAGDVLEAHAREVTTRIQSATLHLADQPRIPASVIRQFLDG